MLDFQLRAAKWRSEHIAPYCDDPIGMPPNREAWLVRVDLQNFDEAAQLGAPVVFIRGQVPDTRPVLAGDRKNALFDVGMPDPLYGGWYRRAHDILQQWQERLRREPEYAGWPVRIDPFGWWSGGPLTLAVALRGHELLTRPVRRPGVRADAADLSDRRHDRPGRAHARFWGMARPARQPVVRRRRAADALREDGAASSCSRSICRLKKEMSTCRTPIASRSTCAATRRGISGWLKEELGVNEFETGFPVDHGKIRRELGPDVLFTAGRP